MGAVAVAAETTRLTKPKIFTLSPFETTKLLFYINLE